MHRLAWAFLVVFVAGCGKSFQEADAIYKDEVAKLEALKDDCWKAACKRAEPIAKKKTKEFAARIQNGESTMSQYKRWYSDLVKEKDDEVRRERDAEIREQEKRVERAYAIREAAK